MMTTESDETIPNNFSPAPQQSGCAMVVGFIVLLSGFIWVKDTVSGWFGGGKEATPVEIATIKTPHTLSLSGKDKLHHWNDAFGSERRALADAMVEQAGRHGVTTSDLQACIDEVARDPATGSQTIASVAAACVVLLEK